jgi:hypothetical protein
MTEKFHLIVMLIVMTITAGMAQENELQPVDDGAAAIGSILGGNSKGVTKVRVIADTEQSLTLEVTYKGFDEKSKLTGAVLNKIQKPVKEVTSESKVLQKADGTVELKFQFKQGAGSYNKTFVESNYVSFSVGKADGILGNLELGGENILVDNYLYKLDKKWRVSGSEQMVITVKLTPFKSAASIAP